MLIKRLLFSGSQEQEQLPPKRTFKQKAIKLGRNIKKYYDEHGAVGTAEKGAEIAWNYTKEHPEDVAIEVASYTALPLAIKKVLGKGLIKNKTLVNAISWGSTTLPVGESIIAAKAAHRLKKQEKLEQQKKNKNGRV